MKNVNAKWYAFKYKLMKILAKSIEEDNNAIKNGAKITFENYCKIQLINCSRKSWSKEAQTLADKYLTELGFEKQETNYLRIDIDNVPAETDEKVAEVFNEMQNSNDKDIKRVASKVANNK